MPDIVYLGCHDKAQQGANPRHQTAYSRRERFPVRGNVAQKLLRAFQVGGLNAAQVLPDKPAVITSLPAGLQYDLTHVFRPIDERIRQEQNITGVILYRVRLVDATVEHGELTKKFWDTIAPQVATYTDNEVARMFSGLFGRISTESAYNSLERDIVAPAHFATSSQTYALAKRIHALSDGPIFSPRPWMPNVGQKWIIEVAKHRAKHATNQSHQR